MGRCYTDCTKPRWYVYAAFRRWRVAAGALVASVYIHRACASCSALAFEGFDVECYALGRDQQIALEVAA